MFSCMTLQCMHSFHTIKAHAAEIHGIIKVQSQAHCTSDFDVNQRYDTQSSACLSQELKKTKQWELDARLLGYAWGLQHSQDWSVGKT